jgi:hypothetical protein
MQALEALTHKKWFRVGLGEPNDPKVEAAITALSAAIEAAEKQEPVASIYISQSGEREFDDWKCKLFIGRNLLYTTPPAAEPEQQAEPFSAVSIYATQTAWKMGYKAAKAEMQLEQEPCIGKDPRCPCQDGDVCHYKDCVGTKARPVAQRTWVGLTDEDWDKVGDMPDTFDQGAAWAAARLKAKNDH